MLVGDGAGPADAARRQADVIAGSRTRSTDNPPPRHEGQRRAGDAGNAAE